MSDSHSDIVAMLKTALVSWAAKHKAYGPLFKTLSPGALRVIEASLGEMQAIKPGVWDYWWANEHMRFVGACQQREMARVHEIMHYFLTDLARGRLEAIEEGRPAGSKASGAHHQKAAKGRNQGGEKSRA